MTKKILYLTVIGTLLLFMVALAADINQQAVGTKSKTAPMKHSILLTGNEPLPSVPYAPIRYHLAASSPGDTVGWTQYDYQSNGSSGNRVALDNTGGVHFDWMNAPTLGVVRKVSYNYITSSGEWVWPGVGTYVSYAANGDGYCQLSVTTDDRAAAAYHRAPTGNESTFVAIDVATGIGSFDYYRPLIRFGAEHCIWPYITIDRTNRIHMTASEVSPTPGDEQTIGYIRSSDGGATWSTPAVVDTTQDIATIITSSPVSDKVAIVYANPLDPNSQWYNDIYYIQSLNGTTWDFRDGKHDVTGYGTDDDSLYAYTDLDAVYDFNDNLHIIWNAQLIDTVLGSIYYSARLFHYGTGTGTISEITRFDSTWTETCEFGAWNFSIAKMSLGVDATNGALFATYTSWNLGDCSTGGYANGDIFMNYSTDNGATWTLRGDVTNSQTPLCEPGDCDSDHWSSLAEHVDDNLHLFYVNDKDPGGAIQTEGATTDNPMLYYAYPNPVRTSAIPVAPALVFPYNDSSYASGYFLFDWMNPVGVISYTIQVDDEVGFGTPIITDAGLTISEYINTDSLEADVYYWRVKSVGYYGESAYSAPFHFEVTAGPSCSYTVGDVNNNGTFNGIDVTYGVGYFKGGNPPPYSCDCNGSTWFVAGDVNGNCAFNGIDISYMVSYFKGGNAPIPCPACTP